jgi:hypothetical protein
MKLPRRKFLHLVVGAAALPVVSRIARAQSYPSHPVRIVVPYAPGGSTDTVARITADRLSRIWGQQVVIENKPGGGTNIAAAAVAGSDPDGYTMFYRQFVACDEPSPLPVTPLRTGRSCAGHAGMHVSSLAAGAQLIAREIGCRIHRIRQREKGQGDIRVARGGDRASSDG